MSIWGSTFVLDATEHADTCARWVPCTCGDYSNAHPGGWMGGNDGRHWRFDAAATCTCLCGPIAYRGSHIFPSDQDPRGGVIDCAEISGDLTPDGHDDGADDDPPWPYLRMGICAAGSREGSDVILLRQQVADLWLYLGDYLRRTRSRPVVDVQLPGEA